jgi:hypothetical protein
VSAAPPPQAGELRLDPESIEAIARRLAELLGSDEPQRSRKQLISAEAVSEWWGVSRRWVYENAKRLGVRRIGTGRRPRLRFDPDEVAEQLGEPTWCPGGRSDARGLPAISGDCGSDSLSPRTRAMVGRQAKKRPGRRTNAPRPGAEGGPSAR